MVASEDFKKALKAGQLAEAFTIAMSQAVELDISTWVDSPGEDSTKISQNHLRTHINLVEGTIENKISERFLKDHLYQEVQQFHLEQVAQGHQIIQNNLASLEKMFHLMAMLQQQKPRIDHRSSSTASQGLETATKQLPSNDRYDLPKETEFSGYNDFQPQQEQPANPPTRLDPEIEDRHKELTMSSVISRPSPDRDENVEFIESDFHAEEEPFILSLQDIDPDSEEEIKDCEEDDWGDWLVEEKIDNDRDQNNHVTNVIDINSLDLEDNEDWQEDDWEETEQTLNSPVSYSENTTHFSDRQHN